jgi:exonuclease SbcD
MIYKNLMRLDYDNARTRAGNAVTGAMDAEVKSAYELFAEFFEMQNNSSMSEEQSEYIKEIIEKIEEDMA